MMEGYLSRNLVMRTENPQCPCSDLLGTIPVRSRNASWDAFFFYKAREMLGAYSIPFDHCSKNSAKERHENIIRQTIPRRGIRLGVQVDERCWSREDDPLHQKHIFQKSGGLEKYQSTAVEDFYRMKSSCVTTAIRMSRYWSSSSQSQTRHHNGVMTTTEKA